MAEIRVGYARVSTRDQDVRAQRSALKRLDVDEANIYTDLGYTGRNMDRPGLRQALAAVRSGDTLVVTKLDRLGRSVTDLRAIAAELEAKGVKLSFGGSTHDPADPAGKLFFTILAAMAEFEADLIRGRTREGMAAAKAAGRLKGKQPKLNARTRKRLLDDYESGRYSMAELVELYPLSRSAIYRTIKRERGSR